MKVLIACEESQEVCKAFRSLGHEAYSCDVQEPSGGHPEWHILGDAVPAPWCGKIQRTFPKAYVTMNFELILVPRTNTYINLNHCSTPDEFKAEVIEGVSRFAFKAFTKPLCKEHLDGINKLLDTKFTPEDMEYIYTNLGNGINHELCMKFVKSGYDLKVIEESV